MSDGLQVASVLSTSSESSWGDSTSKLVFPFGRASDVYSLGSSPLGKLVDRVSPSKRSVHGVDYMKGVANDDNGSEQFTARGGATPGSATLPYQFFGA